MKWECALEVTGNQYKCPNPVISPLFTHIFYFK